MPTFIVTPSPPLTSSIAFMQAREFQICEGDTTLVALSGFITTSPLSLFVPEPECRPGDHPDFGEMLIPEAGAVRMPPIDVEPMHIHDLAYSVIRVH